MSEDDGMGTEGGGLPWDGVSRMVALGWALLALMVAAVAYNVAVFVIVGKVASLIAAAILAVCAVFQWRNVRMRRRLERSQARADAALKAAMAERRKR